MEFEEDGRGGEKEGEDSEDGKWENLGRKCMVVLDEDDEVLRDGRGRKWGGVEAEGRREDEDK